MVRVSLLTLLLLSPSFAAGAEPPAAHRATGDLAIQARDILGRHCAACHTGSAEPGASKLKLLDHRQLMSKRPVALISRNRSQLLELVKDGSMPPANRPGPTAAEIAVLEQWVKAGAPAYPEAFDDRYTFEAIADDLDRENAKTKKRDVAEYVRYVSFAHLVRDGQPLPDLANAEQRLSGALLAASGNRVTPEPVDPAATLFRVDLRELGWAARGLFEKVDRRKPAGAHPLRAYDIILLEYPHTTTPTGSVAKRLEPLLDARNQARPVAFVRGDWLAAALSLPKQYRTPLALELLSLGALGEAVAGGKEKPDGPGGPRVLGSAKPLAGRVAVPPLSGWYASDVTPDPAPFALTAELVAGGQPLKRVKVDQPFKLKVQSDRRVFLTLLMVQADGEVRIQEVEGGSVLQPNTPRELAPGPDGFSISGIVTGDDSATEYFVLFACESELPPPTIVRSLHSERPVWRFLLEPSVKEAFDASKVVRKVVPVAVSKK